MRQPRKTLQKNGSGEARLVIYRCKCKGLREPTHLNPQSNMNPL